MLHAKAFQNPNSGDWYVVIFEQVSLVCESIAFLNLPAFEEQNSAFTLTVAGGAPGEKCKAVKIIPCGSQGAAELVVATHYHSQIEQIMANGSDSEKRYVHHAKIRLEC